MIRQGGLKPGVGTSARENCRVREAPEMETDRCQGVILNQRLNRV